MRIPLRVLIVEDLEDDAMLLLRELRRSGYEPVYERVDTESAMKKALTTQEWDAIIADYVVPGFGALPALALLKEQGQDIPIIVVTGATGEVTAVQAMKAGAHDCVMKSNLARLGPAIQRELQEAEVRRARRRAEQQLAYQANLLENVHDAVVATDENFRLSAWNRAAETIFGWRQDEVINQPMPEILFTELTREEFNKIVQELAETGSFFGELTLNRKDGRPVAIEATTIPLKNDDGKVTGYVSVNRDITFRKQVEEELRSSREQLRNHFAHLQAVREEERTSIAREIHDELGQTLTALKMDLSWLKHRLPEGSSDLDDKVKAMFGLINSTIKTVQRISAELRPGLLDDLGLSAAIEWQAKEFHDRSGIQCRVNFNPDDIVTDRDRSTVIFRIFQETLTNIARHAEATLLNVSLRKNDDKLLLKVRDNGKGISKLQIMDAKSFGLIGMRERVHPWGGKVKIRGVPNRGTIVMVSIPLNGSALP